MTRDEITALKPGDVISWTLLGSPSVTYSVVKWIKSRMSLIDPSGETPLDILTLDEGGGIPTVFSKLELSLDQFSVKSKAPQSPVLERFKFL